MENPILPKIKDCTIIDKRKTARKARPKNERRIKVSWDLLMRLRQKQRPIRKQLFCRSLWIPEEVEKYGKGYDVTGATIIDPATYEKTEEYLDLFVELRKKKGLTKEEARKQALSDYAYYGCLMIKAGDADGMVSGAIHSSADTIRPSLQILKTAPGTKLVSAFFIMNVPNCEYGHNGTFIFGDCGLNQDPTADEVSEIAISSAASYKQLIQDEPRVAMLSYSTYGSAKSALVDKMQEATKLAKEKAPELKLDGELQLDAAIVDNVAKSKAPSSDVAGSANVLIFPNLDAGNKPVNDLSRGCSAEDIAGVVAITAIQAQNN